MKIAQRACDDHGAGRARRAAWRGMQRRRRSWPRSTDAIDDGGSGQWLGPPSLLRSLEGVQAVSATLRLACGIVLDGSRWPNASARSLSLPPPGFARAVGVALGLSELLVDPLRQATRWVVVRIGGHSLGGERSIDRRVLDAPPAVDRAVVRAGAFWQTPKPGRPFRCSLFARSPSGLSDKPPHLQAALALRALRPAGSRGLRPS